MDKYEYKLRVEEIRERIAEGDYTRAAELSDTIDWRRVKKAGTLCAISDLYKKVRRYDDALELLQMAYERYPGGKDICYALCELYIKTGDFIQAVECYKEFVLVAPRDSRRYILQYRIYEAQDISLEERIEVLEELKARDYREKWAYELAYLYHRVGLGIRCVEECDELITWFGTGKYVYKAMELKSRHEPLRPDQQEKYDRRFQTNYGEYDPDAAPAEPDEQAEAEQTAVEEMTEAPVDAPAETFAETSAENSAGDYGDAELPAYEMTEEEQDRSLMTEEEAAAADVDDSRDLPNDGYGETIDASVNRRVLTSEDAIALALGHTQVYHGPVVEEQIDVRPIDVSACNTQNLQQMVAEGMKEIWDDGNTGELDPIFLEPTGKIIDRKTGTVVYDSNTGDLEEAAIEDVSEEDLEPETVSEHKDVENTELFFSETGEMKEIGTEDSNVVYPEDVEPSEMDVVAMLEAQMQGDEDIFSAYSAVAEEALVAQPPQQMAEVMTQEADGQLSLVLPESQKLDKQITGQINLMDVMSQWDRMKQDREDKNREALHQQMFERTGQLFTEFEQSVMNSLYEQIEREADLAAAAAEAETEAEDDAVEELEEILEGDAFEDEDETAAAAEREQTEEPAEEPADDSEDDTVEELTELEETEPDRETIDDRDQPAEEAADAVTEETIAEEAAETAAAEAEEIAEEAGEATAAEAEEIAEEAGEATAAEAEEISEDAGETTAETEEYSQVEEPAEEDTAVHLKPARNLTPARELSKEEKDLFGPYIQTRSAKAQLVNVLDNISLAPYAGNLILTGDDGINLNDLATGIMKELKEIDANFTGQVGTVEGQNLSAAKVEKAVSKLNNGALLIEKASSIPEEGIHALCRGLEKENFGIVVVLIDNRRNMEKFLEKNPGLMELFDVRMHVEALSNDRLVAFGKQYALSREFSIDKMGELALHTLIQNRQTSDHAVTVLEVKEIVDEAIKRASKKTPKHFFEVLLGKRYDNEDMIVLGEKDFA